MKYYRCWAETYHNGKLIGAQSGGGRLTEKELPAEEKFVLTWENLSEMYNKLDLLCNFNVWNFKKGGIIIIFRPAALERNSRFFALMR